MLLKYQYKLQALTLLGGKFMISYEDKQLMEQLMESNEDFKHIINKLVEENRQMLSSLTHEIRNPLTLIKSTFQLIGEQHPETKDFKFWNQIELDINQTVDLLNDLSAYNHSNSLQTDVYDLYELITDTIDSFLPLIETSSLSLTTYFDDSILLDIYAYTIDAGKFREVLINLLKNAVEAADSNSTINVSVTKAIDSKNMNPTIDISITNEGDTIPEDELVTIFQPFVTSKSAGTGLGLPICQQIIEQHNGTLFVTQGDHSVTFHIYLPLHTK